MSGKRIVVLLGAMICAGICCQAQPVCATPGISVIQDSSATESADEGAPATTQAQTAHAVRLSIDTEHTYDGMDKPYAQGYVPTAADGCVRLVFPILADGELTGQRLTASLDLGDTDTAPFVFKNYEKTVRLAGCNVNQGAEEVSAYAADFTVDLKQGRVNGSYPVTLKAVAADTNGNEITQEFTVYVTITDGVDPNATTEQTTEAAEPVTEELPTFAPKVIVKGYTFSKAEILPGDEITAEITLYNTSAENSVRNMTVAVTADNETLTLLSESDSVYIERINPREQTVVTFSYRVNAGAPAGQYDLTLTMDYADGDGNTYTAAGTAKLTVGQYAEMQFDAVSIPDEVVVADVVEAKVQAMNLGRCKVYNVRAEIAADGLTPQETIFFGDMEAGSAVTAGTQITVSSLSGSTRYGKTDGTVTYYYEDESGKEYTQEAAFSVTVRSPFSEEADQTEPDDTGQWWILAAVILAVCAGFLMVGIVRRILRRRIEVADRINSSEGADVTERKDSRTDADR